MVATVATAVVETMAAMAAEPVVGAVKWPFRGKTRSGDYTEFKPSVVYEVRHTVQVWGEAGAKELTDILHGRFSASYAHDPGDTLGCGLYVVTLMHRGVPDRSTVTRARKTIDEVIEEAGVKARYQGYQRHEIGPADAPRKPWLRDDDADDQEDDSPAGLPLPLKSG